MLETEHGCNLIHELNDVPDIIKIGGKQMLLGSYLKNKLRERIGIVTKEHIETTQKKIWFLNKDMEWDYNIETTTKKRTTNETKEKKLSLLRQEKIEEYLSYREENPSLKALSQKEFLIDKHLQKVRDLEKRMTLKNSKGEL